MIKPHGSETLNPLFVQDAQLQQQLLTEAESLPSLLLNSAAAANAVMMGAGYFNPLTGYMNLADALSVAETLHTAEGLFWPVPVLNLVEDVSGIQGARRIALRDPNTAGHPVMAIMDVSAIEAVSDEQINLMAQEIFGTLDPEHPGVSTFTFKPTSQILSALLLRFATKLPSAAGRKLSPSKRVILCTEPTKSFAAWPWSV